MKSIGLRSNAPILQKTAKRNIVRHPAELSNILGLGDNGCMFWRKWV